MLRPVNRSQPRTASGFSLLEAMIALLVFSAGVLGVVAMQVGGTRLTQASQNLTIGTFVADDMAERMRANLAGAQAGTYDNQCVCNGTCSDTTRAANCSAALTTCPTDPATVSRSCYGASCTAAAVAAADLDEWLLKVCASTPPGTLAGVYCSGTCDASSSRSIIVSWVDTETSAASSTTPHHIQLVLNPIAPRN